MFIAFFIPIEFNNIYMNNSFIYGLIFGLILVPGFTGIELRFLSFLVKLFKLNFKFNKPVEVLALLISELITIFFTSKTLLTALSLYGVLIILFLFLKIFALWNTKKWALYIYLLFAILSVIKGGIFQINNIWLGLISIVSQALILLVYYLYVYEPNKKEFI